MKILQICNKPPYPPVDGGSMAMSSVTTGLLESGCEVKVLSVCSDKHPVKESDLGEYAQQVGFESVYIDLRAKVVPAAIAMLCGESYNVKRYESEDFAKKLREILDKDTFDIVHIESIFLTPYVPLIRKHSQAKIALRAHNVEHHIWRQVAECTHNAAKRWYLKHLALALRAYELQHINDYDAVVCITKEDARYFKNNGCRKPITAIPFGVEAEDIPMVNHEPNSLFHIGAMDWMPNIDSIGWLLDDIWPKIHSEVPQAHLYLAGRKMPERWMNAKIEGVSVVGEVPDAMQFIAGKQLNIVPLRSGSGIRVKIIEAMSAGKTVITTSQGAHGIEYTDGENILIANTAEEFVAQVKHCLEDEAYSRRIGAAAAKLIAERYNRQVITNELIKFYNQKLTDSE